MFMQTTGDTIVVHRTRKYEAEKAIADLEKRGYEVIYPLTQQKRDGKRFESDGYRQVFVENMFSSTWIAKLRRVAE